MTDESETLIVIRDIESIDEMGAVEELQRVVWQCADIDVVPRMLLHPAREVGGALVGAYDGAQLVGFACGIVGIERGALSLHSHLLAVLPAYRAHGLGFRLKLAQRERALAHGIRRMTWTFDPLQSRNAHLNFARLGVVSDDYRVNYYGDVSTSPLHTATGTDRLWVTWHLDDERIVRRIEETTKHRAELEHARAELADAQSLVSVGDEGEPVLARLKEGAHVGLVSIEIPADIDELQRDDLALARRWREATRGAFRVSLSAGHVVEDFIRTERGGAYLLRRRVAHEG
jgi:predicted GNAT superfamily acetyltransferase